PIRRHCLFHDSRSNPPSLDQCLCRLVSRYVARFHHQSGNSMKEQRFVRELMGLKRKILLFSFVVAAIFFVLILRLWHLQILSADDYRNMSENNRLRFVPIAASRGAILDRNGKLLVSNRPSFSLAVVPQEVKDKDLLLNQLASLLGLDR